MPRTERRDQLLGVARAIFAVRGYEATSVEIIAEAAGVTRPIVYDHFGDKQGLFAAVVDAEMRRVRDAVATAISGPGEPSELLERGLRAYFSYVREHPEGHAVLVRDAPVHLSGEGIGVMIDELTNVITEVITRASKTLGLDPAPAPIYANVLIGLGVHVGRWWRRNPGLSLDEVTAHTTALLWNGFGGLMANP